MPKPVHTIWRRVSQTFTEKRKSVTLNFLFVMVFVTLFQRIFGQENSIVGVILIIIMCSAMLRDLTSTPVKQCFIQAGILEAMTIAAFLVTHLPLLGAAVLNFSMLALLLYAFTFEYATHLYMPYIISYLFLVFLSPITAQQLPMRCLGMLVGAVCVILYQVVMGRKRILEIPRAALSELVEEACDCVRCLLSSEGRPDNPQMVHSNLCKLSRLIFERRKRTLCISDASFAMLDCGRALERLILLLYDMEGPVTPERIRMLEQAELLLDSFHVFLSGKAEEDRLLNPEEFAWQGDSAAEPLRRCLRSIRDSLRHMTDPDRRATYRKTIGSVWTRLKAALNVSSVRVVYALRVAALLTLATAFVQAMQLPHGKWLVFTLASVSLPYAEDVPGKGKKRLLATLLGGCSFVIVYSLVPSSGGRTLFMMLAGYLTSYFTDYSFSFACSTVGGLSASATTAYGFGSVAFVFLIRLCYICLGILLAHLFNCVLFPYKRRMATYSLWKKYLATTAAIKRLCCSERNDPQLYFSLIIQAYLQEEKLWAENNFDQNEEGRARLLRCQATIRDAAPYKINS